MLDIIFRDPQQETDIEKREATDVPPSVLIPPRRSEAHEALTLSRAE